MPVPEDIHSDSTVHNDDHTDGAGDNHTDFHSDSAGNHTDTGGNLESRSTGDRLSGKDRPMDIHTDYADHTDIPDHTDAHSDGGGGGGDGGHSDSHGDGPGNHQDNALGNHTDAGGN